MNKKDAEVVAVVSLFGGMDVFLWGFVLAGMKAGYACEYNKWAAKMHELNFKDFNGNPVVHWKHLSADEMKPILKKLDDPKAEKKRKKQVRIQYILNKDGSAIRPEMVQELDGAAIRKQLEKIYVVKVRIVLIGGAPCQDFTKLNVNSDGERNILIFEFIRVMRELDPDVAVMEEVPDVLNKHHFPLYKRFLTQAHGLGYQVAYRVMNALHYDGCQNRERCIAVMVNNRLQEPPVFPEPRPESAIRIGEALDVDHLFSGHFTDVIKTRYEFAGTVTSGSPLWVKKDGVKREPTFEEKLRLQGVAGDLEYEFPEDVPKQQVKLAIGNAVPLNLSFFIGKTIMEEIFEIPVDFDYQAAINGTKEVS